MQNGTTDAATCDMCGKTKTEGCGYLGNHVERIHGDQPDWLPAHYRAQAQGEYAWMCLRCNSFPAMKWPRESGAEAGLEAHMGAAHRTGPVPDYSPSNVNFRMIRAA